MYDSVHPQVRALLEAMASDGEPEPADLASERAAYLDSALRLGGVAEPVAAVTDLVVPHGDVRLPGRLYTPLHAPDADRAIVWLHGGGWYVGDIPTFDRVARSLANASGCKVLLVEYRLAPERRWPSQVGDADATVAWVRSDAGARQLAIDPAQVLLGGDSAGGQLAVVAARHARTDGLPPLRALLLAYPALDPAMESDSYTSFADGPMLTRADMERCWERYLDGQGAGDPDAAPLLATDHAGMPPTWVAVAGQDPVRDDGVRYAAALSSAGIAVQQRLFDDMVHGFLRWGGVVDAAGELIAWLGNARPGGEVPLRELAQGARSRGEVRPEG